MTMFFGGCKERGHFEVGFAVRKSTVSTKKQFRAINPRLLYLKIETK